MLKYVNLCVHFKVRSVQTVTPRVDIKGYIQGSELTKPDRFYMCILKN